MHKAVVRVLILGVAAAVGAGAMWLWKRETAPEPVSVVCRPSLPALYAAHEGRPGLLILGNSLMFDVDWRVPGYVSANCARQGQVARDAVSLVPRLPDMQPAAILLGFGAVEAYRAALADGPVAPEVFRVAMTQLIDGLRTRWPSAHVLVAGTLFPGTGGPHPALVRHADVVTLNQVLVEVANGAGARFLDVAGLPLVQSGRAGDITYDGLHLTDAVYDQWRALLIDALDATQ